AGGSNGYRAVLVRRQLTPGLISSLPGTAGLPPCLSFSTSYPELPPMPNRMARRLLAQGASARRKPRSPEARGPPPAQDPGGRVWGGGGGRGKEGGVGVRVLRHAEPSAAADCGGR